MVGIVFVVIGVITLLMRSLITPSKNDPVKTPGIGVIKRRIDEKGRVWFYVEFQDRNGTVYVGQSITYRSTKHKYYEGDTAKIWYYFSRVGKPLVALDDPDLVSCEQSAKPVSVMMLIFAIVMFALGAMTLVSFLLI